jgi:protein-tyrosine kinase
MSIIERAAGRLNKDKGAAAGAEPAAVPLSDPLSTAATAAAAEFAAPEFTAPAGPQAIAAAAPPEPTVRQQRESRSQRPMKSIDINLTRLSQLGFITAGGGRSMISEQFRMVKRPLIKRAFAPTANGTPGNLIMVTSSLPGEGKTFCSINLAMSIAMELDHTVLLVDVDVVRPSVLRTFGVEAKPGLMDMLLDEEIDMGDVLLRTNVDTLSVLPSGKGHNHASELLASQAMNTMLEEIANRYPDRIVIFDSPPLLVTSEAHILASKMGQIVMVVEAESTTQQAVKSSLEQLQGCSNVNLIYNKSKAFGAKDYGYYY